MQYLQSNISIGNIIIFISLVFLGVMVLSMAIQWFLVLGKRRIWHKMIFRSLLFSSIAAGYTFLLLTNSNEKMNLYPLQSWRRIGELGYVAVCVEMGLKGGPFFLMGLFLPLAYKKINRIYKVAPIALGLAIIGSLITTIVSGFNVDVIIYGLAFCVAGFSFTTLLAWIFVKVKYLQSIEFSRMTHIFGVFWLMAVYFSFMATMFLNNGSQIVSLKLPVMSQQFPQDTTIEASLTSDRRSIAILRATKVDLQKEAEQLMPLLDMRGDTQSVVDEQKKQHKIELEASLAAAQAALTQAQANHNASNTTDTLDALDNARLAVENIKESLKTLALQEIIITDGPKTLLLNVSGYWKYTDQKAAQKEGVLPTDEKIIDIATNFVGKGLAPNYVVEQSEVYSKRNDVNGVPNQAVVYITGQYNGLEVIGSCEFFVTIGPDGGIVEIEKYDPNFEQFKTKKMISSEKAAEYFRAYQVGEQQPKKISVSHNLYQPAVSAVLTTTRMAYWLDETSGTMQPIWVFSGTAMMEDGSEQNVNVYVSAIE